MNRSCLGLLLAGLLLGACSGGGGGGGKSAALPSLYELLTPEHLSENNMLSPEFSWTDAEEEASYTLQISRSEAFEEPLVYEVTGLPADATSHSLPAGIMESGSDYLWRVIAVNEVGQTIASRSPFLFSTIQGGSILWDIPSDPSEGSDFAHAVALDDDGIYVVGSEQEVIDTGTWRIEKRDRTSGALVNGFGIEGVVRDGEVSSGKLANAVVVGEDAIYVGGRMSTDQGTIWLIEKRAKSDGMRIDTFGNEGVISDPATEGPIGFVNAMAVSDTALYIGGNVGFGLRIEKRKISDGSLLWVKEISDPGLSNTYSVEDIVVMGDYLYTAGSDIAESDSTQQWRIEKRRITDGVLDSDFGMDGVVHSHPGQDDTAKKLASDGHALYIGGYVYSTYSDSEWRVEKRDPDNGELLIEFGDEGVLTINPGPSQDVLSAMAIDNTYLFLAGYDSVSLQTRWHVQKHSAIDGDAVGSFGIDGVETRQSANDSFVSGIAVDAAAIYVIGFDRDAGTNGGWRIEKRVK